MNSHEQKQALKATKPLAASMLAMVALSGCGSPASVEKAPELARCDGLNIQYIGGLTITAETEYTFGNGASFKGIQYTFEKGGKPLDAPSKDPQGVVMHTYKNPGTYDIESRVLFSDSGQTFMTLPTPACETEFTIKLPK